MFGSMYHAYYICLCQIHARKSPKTFTYVFDFKYNLENIFLKVGDAMTLIFTNPLFTMLFAAIFLGHRLTFIKNVSGEYYNILKCILI